MWTISQLGLASAVQDRRAPDFLFVRFRDPGDAAAYAQAIKAATKLERMPSVWQDNRADYRWRLRVRKDRWALTLVHLTCEIDYPNFKSMMHARNPRWSGGELMQIWAAGNNHQRDLSNRRPAITDLLPQDDDHNEALTNRLPAHFWQDDTGPGPFDR